MIKYFKISKVKDWDKGKNNKLMSFHIDDEKLLETYRAFDQMEDLEITKLDALPVLDDIYIYIYIYIYICI